MGQLGAGKHQGLIATVGASTAPTSRQVSRTVPASKGESVAVFRHGFSGTGFQAWAFPPVPVFRFFEGQKVFMFQE